MAILILTVMLSATLAYADYVFAQISLSAQVVASMNALNAADSGVEWALYEDVMKPSILGGNGLSPIGSIFTYCSTNASTAPCQSGNGFDLPVPAPFGSSSSSTYFLTQVDKSAGNVTNLTSTGYNGTTRRAVQLSY